MKGHSVATRFAVDFVILPPEHVMDIAVSLNKRACKDSYIFLDKKTSFPHVSLLMGCLTLDQIKNAKIMLKAIASQHKEMNLSVTKMRPVNTSGGEIMTLDIDPHSGLQLLHEFLVKDFAPLLSKDATEEEVFDPAPTASTLDWINGYIPNSCLENFWPHITIGYMKEDSLSERFEPFSFVASRLAVCHLGNYCTCKRILAEARLAE